MERFVTACYRTPLYGLLVWALLIGSIITNQLAGFLIFGFFVAIWHADRWVTRHPLPSPPPAGLPSKPVMSEQECNDLLTALEERLRPTRFDVPPISLNDALAEATREPDPPSPHLVWPRR